MMSKKLLSHSLFSVYRQCLHSEEKQVDVDLKKEIWVLAQNPEFFNQKEIVKNKEQLSKMEDMSRRTQFICHIDGSLKVRYDNREMKTGKRLKAGSAFVIESDNEMVIENYFRIPNTYKEKDTTIHMAEYQALISCLRTLRLYHPNPEMVDVQLFSDSEDLVKQVNFEVRTRNKAQIDLRQEALECIRPFKSVSILHCPREENERADTLSKRSLEEKEWVDSTIEPILSKGESL